MIEIDAAHLERCARTLDAHGRGRDAMRTCLRMLDEGAIALDGTSQQALLTLLIAAFTTHPGTARDVMRNVLNPVRSA